MTRGVGLREALEAQAAALGFDRLAVAPARPLERWRREAGENPHWAGLTWNPRQLLPGAERVVLLLKGYRPYAPRPGLVSLSAYYPCSQWAYQHSPALARTLEAAGFQALCHPALPYKPCLALAGTAAYGRNGLTALSPWGSRFAVQAVLTDAPLPLDPPQPPAAQPCGQCGACLRACPVGALDGEKVDVSKCLRALAEGQPVPRSLWPLLGNSLLGCDLCQQVCPRGREGEREPMPPELARALDLPSLLAGQVRPLVPWIGANYARKKRIQARACLIAANLGRTDCLPLLEPLTQDPYPPLHLHARWAIQSLTAREAPEP